MFIKLVKLDVLIETQYWFLCLGLKHCPFALVKWRGWVDVSRVGNRPTIEETIKLFAITKVGTATAIGANPAPDEPLSLVPLDPNS